MTIFLLPVGLVLLLIALAFLGSPLFALILAVPAALVLIALLVLRRKPQEAAPAESRERPLTPEGKPTALGGKASGAPVSGEG